MIRPLRLLLPGFALLGAALARDSAAEGPDPAARGLDVFVHVPPEAAPGGVIPIAVQAVGFATVVSPAPLPQAAVEAVWNPETLGKVAVAPPPVKATADAEGRAHLDVPVPDGDEGDLELLVGVRSGSHDRTRKIKIHRTRLHDASLFVPDSKVVPGGATSAWVTVRSAQTGAPVGGAPVRVALLEGGVPRFEVQVVTDPSGSAMTRVPIPRAADPAWTWTLEAQTLGAGKHHGTTARVTLTPREETPGAPRLSVAWTQDAVFAGDRADFALTVRDAADRPVAALPVRYWIGPRGTTAPKEEEAWIKASKLATTDAAGEVRGSADTPRTVVQGVGTTLQLVVRGEVDGHALSGESTVKVGSGGASAELSPEAHDLVPGVEQRLLLRVRDGRARPVVGPFLVEGDGLRREVRTGASGEVEVVWKVPSDIGAARSVGPCAGGVAASVRVRATAEIPELLPRRDPFEICLAVDREAAGIVRADRSAARVGERIHVTVAPAEPSGEAGGGNKRDARKGPLPRGPWSVVARSANGAAAIGIWIEDGEKGGDFVVPSGASGAWTISAAMPAAKRAARVLGTSILVTPQVLPRLSAKIAGGRATPGGTVDVEAALTDDQGRPLRGSVAALMIDARGGGSTRGIEHLDTRRSLCQPFSIEPHRCDPLVEGDPSLDLLRRADLMARAPTLLGPVLDPGAAVSEKLRKAFGLVVRSLEGGVNEVSGNPDQLRDVRRRVGKGFQFNPELLTLVTATIDPPPETPGGEPLALGDLVTIDPQVTFDNVARRVTRRKIFFALVAFREFRREHLLDADEPALRDPNAILRRLVREQRLHEGDLVDPWGHTLQFVKSTGPGLPFLTAVRGWELRSPGPDGTLGNGDDVRDPFERVLKSGSPYAEAVEEDRVLDAKFEMEVSDATVEGWKQLFTTTFGSMWGGAIGDSNGAGGLGLSGFGSGGGGVGHGHGLGRYSFGVVDGVAFWSAPQRTGDDGKILIHVPLGDVETTWRLALVGIPDGGSPATTGIDIPSSLPLSVRVDAGATWVEGDEGVVPVTVRSRGGQASVSLAIAASGVASLAEGGAARTVEVPAGGAAVVPVRIRVAGSGTARLEVRATAAGVPEDVATHSWEVRPAAEPNDFSSARWVEDEAELALTLPPASIRLAGAPRLVIERGWDQALAGALESLDPDTLTSPRAMADAVEVASRLGRWAIARGGEKDPLALRAADVARRATGRLAAFLALHKESAQIPVARAHAFAPVEEAQVLGKIADCPAEGTSVDARLEQVEAEPAPEGGAAKACWDAFVADTEGAVTSGGDPEDLARLVLALAERPHRRVLAAALAERLRERVALKPTGGIRLADELVARRSTRAVVFAALLRSIHLGKPAAAPADRVAAFVGVQRDADGGYGSPLATRSVVRALVAEGGAAGAEASHVRFEGGGEAREIDVPPTAHLVLPLPTGTGRVSVRVKGPGVIARFERPVLRLWSSPPADGQGPVHVEATWPDDAGRAHGGKLRLRIRHGLARAVPVDLTVPLPPGVTLAERVKDVRQIQGVLAIRRTVEAGDAPTVLELPLRFALEGRFTVPEARARVAFEDLPRTIVPARPIVVR